ncbi:hypothetical protein DM02DRAFT_636492 [Periconia macrospinosa]|uniref:Zn(2)-C6 fungal-type domain-containing protein n=1 Tax=Periconia macrospinosa TaxID=97972 RepID=A0A2V1D0V0_9PLEO|nr:hypothetical protein DM02DRAFT_636492 [Periconia macrospinosa]
MAPRKGTQGACDPCSVRKVRCDGLQPCTRCEASSWDCTYVRTHGKSGPKGPRRTTKAAIRRLQERGEGNLNRRARSESDLNLDDESPSTVDLPPLEPLPRSDQPFNSPGWPDATSPLLPRHTEPRRISTSSISPYLEVYQERGYGIWPVVDVDVLLARLLTHSDDMEAYALATAICAATISQFQIDAEPGSPVEGHFHTEQQQHSLRVYWLLFITESAHSIQHGVPTTLKRTPYLPQLDNLNDGSVTKAFVQLCRLFHILDVTITADPASARNALALAQQQLSDDQPLLHLENELQRADMSITQQWMRVFLWQHALSVTNLRSSNIEDEFSFSFPARVARSALNFLCTLPKASLEAHGPGMESKLFDITTVTVCPGTFDSVFGGLLSPLLGSLAPKMPSPTPATSSAFIGQAPAPPHAVSFHPSNSQQLNEP